MEQLLQSSQMETAPGRNKTFHALVSHGIDLATGLAAAAAIDAKFDPATSIRALQFYGDGNLSGVPTAMQQDLTQAWAPGVRVIWTADLCVGGRSVHMIDQPEAGCGLLVGSVTRKIPMY